ncbi:hypothetical protein GLUCOINTEAF2_0203175 [Komagataeibacter intermedius AF2]|uniref:Uncharacterized protein n=1 Tax=Komagataeibacter intermedius AF2 TaxID=1458464 RepID=A0A0N0MDZ2_9PROT|nr:hypothetical protein GLUCOINTEAF2_0203175 [Komagataeibacter intermedius AF2]
MEDQILSVPIEQSWPLHLPGHVLQRPEQPGQREHRRKLTQGLRIDFRKLRLAPSFPQSPVKVRSQILTGTPRIGEQSACQNGLPIGRHETCCNPVPLLQCPGCRAFMHQNRITTPQQVSRHQALAGSDVRDFIQAHDRSLEGTHVGAVTRPFLPAPTLEVNVDEVPAVIPVLPEKILEGAAPQRHGNVGADHLRQILEGDVARFQRRTNVIAKHFAKTLLPVLLAEISDQSREFVCGHDCSCVS